MAVRPHPTKTTPPPFRGSRGCRRSADWQGPRLAAPARPDIRFLQLVAMFAPDGTVCAARIPGRAVSWNEQGRRAAREGGRVLRATGGRSLETVHGGLGCPRSPVSGPCGGPATELAAMSAVLRKRERERERGRERNEREKENERERVRERERE